MGDRSSDDSTSSSTSYLENIPILQQQGIPESEIRRIYYDILFSGLPDGVLLTDPEGKILAANPSFYRIFGYRPEDILGRSIQLLSVDPEVKVEIETNFPLLREGAAFKQEVIRPRKDGSPVHALVYGGPIVYSEQVIGVYVIYADITARKNAEESLRTSEERFRFALDATNEGIWEWNVPEEEVLLSPRCYSMLGYNSGELPVSLQTLKRLLHPEDKEETLLGLTEHLHRNEEAFELEFRLRKKNGDWLWILARGKVVDRSLEGKPLRLVGTIADIGERKASEEALAIQREYMEKLFLNSPEGIVLVDHHGKVIQANDHFYQIFGYQQEEVIGKEVDLLVADHPDILNDARFVTETMRKGIHVEREVFRTRKDGTLFPVSIIAVPFQIHGGQQAYYLIYRDISNRKAMEENLRESETRYRTLFEQSSISLWEEDWSEVKTFIKDLPVKGIRDLRKFLAHNPEKVLECISKIRVLRVNRASVDLFEAKDERELHNGLAAIYSEQSCHSFIEEFLSIVVKSETHFESELNHKTLKGTDRFVSLHVDVPQGYEDSLERVFVSIVDVTEREQARENLLKEKQLWEMLFENAPLGILFSYDDEVILRANRQFCDMFGYREEEIVGKSINQVVAGEGELRADADRVSREVSQGDGISTETFRRRKDGSMIPVSLRVVSFRTSEGRTIHYGLYEDISARLAYQKEITSLSQYLGSIIDNANVWMTAIDRNNDVIIWNKAAEESSGYTRNEVIGHKDATKWIYPHEKERRRVENIMSEAIKNRETVKDISSTITTREGEQRTFQWSFHILKDDSGEYNGAVSVGFDITEEIRTRKSLMESEKFSKSLLVNSPQPIVVYGPDLTIRFVNPALEALTGFSSSELIGTGYPFPWWPKGREREYFQLFEDMVKKSKETGDLEFQNSKGESFWVETILATVQEDEQIHYFVSNWTDVTYRKIANHELEKEKRYWQQLFENSPEGIVLFDSNDRVLRVNRTFCELFGYVASEVIGRDVDQLVADSPEEFQKAKSYSRSARAGELVSTDTVRYRKDGTSFHVSVLGVPLILQDGTSFGYGIYRDISKRKQAEEELEKEREYLLNLFENAPEGIVLCDRDQKVIQGNHAFCKMFGYSYEEICGKDLDMLVTCDPERLEEARSITRQVLDGTSITKEGIRCRKDGTSLPVSMIGVPFRVGEEYAIYAIYRDISEKVRAEEALRSSYEKLGKALDGIITTMAKMVESRDPYTAGHQQRVSELAVAIAGEMGLSKEMIEGIRVAAVVHDVGKINIPSEILSKPGRLSDIEFRLIKSHPQSAYEILRDIEFPWPIAEIVLQHHERLDGRGYPSGLKGDQILLEARILAVADVVEAMSSHRPYRPGLGIDKALEEIISGRGTLFDEKTVDACVRLFREKNFDFITSQG